MTIAFIAIAFFAIGFQIRRWWTLVIPVTLGTVALAITASRDTPIPFLIVLATCASALGIVVGRKQAARLPS